MLAGVLNALKNFVTFSGKLYWLNPCISTTTPNFIFEMIAFPVNLRR